MKKIHIMLFIIFLPFLVHAQKSFIGLSSGISLPLGEYAKSEYGTFGHEDNEAGFAKTGFNISLEGAWYFSKYFGFGGVTSFVYNGSLSKSDADKLAAGYTDAFAVDESTVQISGSFRLFNVMAGPYFALPVTNKFSIEVRALTGLVKGISTPEMQVTLEDPTDPAQHFVQKSASASSLGFQFGIGTKYSLTETLAITLRGDYFFSNGLKVENENRTVNAGRLVTNQPIAAVNVNIGIAYVFKK